MGGGRTASGRKRVTRTRVENLVYTLKSLICSFSPRTKMVMITVEQRGADDMITLSRVCLLPFALCPECPLKAAACPHWRSRCPAG